MATQTQFISNAPVKFNPSTPDPDCFKDTKLEFCMPVVNGDTTEYQIIAALLTDNLIQNGSFDNPLEIGTATSVSANKLIDATANFLDVGIQPGMLVQNTTDGTISAVSTVDSQTQLTLLTDPFDDVTDAYSISGWHWTSDKWDITGGQLLKTVGTVDPISWEGSFVSGDIYKVTIIANAFSGGTLDVDMGASAQTMSGAGTFVAYFTSFGADITLTPTTDLVATFDSVSVELVERNTVHEVRDENDVVQATLVAGDTSYNSGRLTTSVVWGTDIVLADGTYNFCVLDGFEGTSSPDQIANGLFETNTDWTFGSYTWNNTPETVTLTGVGAASYLLTQNVLTMGKKYTIYYTIKTFVDDSGSLDTKIRVGGVNGTTRTATGTYKETITATGSGNFEFITTIGNANDYIVLDDVYVFLHKDSFSEEAACSNCLCLEDHDCTQVFKWTNDSDAFGFRYESTSLTHYARLKSRLVKPKYPAEKSQFLGSNGELDIIKFRSRKWFDCEIDLLPEFVHDALSIMIGHDDVQIDNVEYIFDDEDYEPRWETDTNGRVTLTAGAKTQDLVNRNC